MEKVTKPTTKNPSRKTSKSPLKKKNRSEKETGIKYKDKSKGQPELIPIFEEIKKLLMPYEKGSIKLRGGSGGQVTLVSEKPVVIEGRKRDRLWFAAALIQKGYVGFYYMPVYGEGAIKSVIKPELLKCLKGKACFHIKKYDREIFGQIKDALALGYKAWSQRGWL